LVGDNQAAVDLIAMLANKLSGGNRDVVVNEEGVLGGEVSGAAAEGGGVVGSAGEAVVVVNGVLAGKAEDVGGPDVLDWGPETAKVAGGDGVGV
jgi:hypothetical protein